MKLLKYAGAGHGILAYFQDKTLGLLWPYSYLRFFVGNVKT